MDYDIIIAGAGPAGLSVAKELGKNNKVLVIDPKPKPKTFAAWYSYGDRIKKNKLEDAVLKRFKSLVYIAQDLRHDMIDDIVVIDSNKVIDKWYDEAKRLNVEFKRASLIDAESKNNSILVKTKSTTNSLNNYSAKLLIDCTGILSPIVQKRKIIDHINTWVISGACVEIKNLRHNDAVYFLPMNDKRNTYIGIYPHSKTCADIYAFYNLNEELGNFSDVNRLFEKFMRKEYPKHKITQKLHGRIVGGELKQYSFDNIVFFGQAGMMDPPGCGMGFNEILRHHKIFSKNIIECLRRNTLDKESLQDAARSFLDPAIFEFQQIIEKYTYYFIFSPTKWRGGVAWLNNLGRDSKYWMRNEFTIGWIEKASIKLYHTIPLKEVLSLMPPRDYAFIFKHFVSFVEGAVLEESSRLEKRYRRELIKK